MEAQAEEQAAEAQKERKLRERNEQYSRQLEEELEGLKVNIFNTHSCTCACYPLEFLSNNCLRGYRRVMSYGALFEQVEINHCYCYGFNVYADTFKDYRESKITSL